MPPLLHEEKSIVNLNIKPKRAKKNPKTKTEIEFRWSVFAIQNKSSEGIPSLSLHSIDLDNIDKKSTSSSNCSTARSTTKTPRILSKQNLSSSDPHLLDINKIEKPILTTDENTTVKKCPLLLSFAQLHQARQFLKLAEAYQTDCSNRSVMSTRSNSSSRSQISTTINNKTRYASRIRKLRSSACQS